MRWADWMVKGTPVVAYGKTGEITRVECTRLTGERTVKFIYVRMYGGKFANPYHPTDVKRLKI